MNWRPTGYVREGEMIPPFHGVTRNDYRRHGYYTAVVPLNWIVSMAVCAWSFIRFGNRAIVLDQRVAYMQGVRDGKRG